MLRARLDGGIRNKAECGELRRGLPVGLVWGEEPGEVRLHPDEAVTGVIRAIFEKFAGCGSVRATWLWLRGEGLSFPLQRSGRVELDWVTPTYTAVHHVLTNPAYAGAYAYGKTRQERRVDETGALHRQRRRLPPAEWEVLIPDHHDGFIDWATWQANQTRIAANTRSVAHAAGDGAIREGTALLPGLAVCDACSRKLAVFYQVSTERNIIGNLVGTYNDLAELMVLAAQGSVRLHRRTNPLDAVNDAMDDLDAGRLQGRGILVLQI